jgi:hypothetical protein
MEINHPLLVQCCICEKKRLLHEDSVRHRLDGTYEQWNAYQRNLTSVEGF